MTRKHLVLAALSVLCVPGLASATGKRPVRPLYRPPVTSPRDTHGDRTYLVTKYYTFATSARQPLTVPIKAANPKLAGELGTAAVNSALKQILGAKISRYDPQVREASPSEVRKYRVTKEYLFGPMIQSITLPVEAADPESAKVLGTARVYEAAREAGGFGGWYTDAVIEKKVD